jgi:cytochrome P450
MVRESLILVLEMFDRMTSPLAPLMERAALSQHATVRAGPGHLYAVVYRIIEDRRRDGTDRGDLLSMLLMATDEEGDGGRRTDEQLRMRR